MVKVLVGEGVTAIDQLVVFVSDAHVLKIGKVVLHSLFLRIFCIRTFEHNVSKAERVTINWKISASVTQKRLPHTLALRPLKT